MIDEKTTAASRLAKKKPVMRGRFLISLAVPTAALQLGVMQPFATPAATLRTSLIFLNEGEGTLSEEDESSAAGQFRKPS